MALYDYGNGDAGLFVFPGTASLDDGSTQPYGSWFTPQPRWFWPSATKVTSGDFNGDKSNDFLALYDYGNGAAGLFVFPGGGEPYRVWYTGTGGFWPSVAKITAGDFNDDGLTDVLALYDYGNESAGLWIFPGTAGRWEGASSPYRVWYTGPQGFDVKRAKLAGGDFNLDGRDDLVALYDYGNAEAGLWVFPGTPAVGDGSSNPYMVWNTLPGNFDVAAVRHTDLDDINADGVPDFIAITDTVVNRFSGTTGSGGSATIRGEYATIPNLENRTKIIVGDYNGNGVADIIFLRDLGNNGSASLSVLVGGAQTTPSRPVVRVWYTGPGGFWPNVTKVA